MRDKHFLHQLQKKRYTNSRETVNYNSSRGLLNIFCLTIFNIEKLTPILTYRLQILMKDKKCLHQLQEIGGKIENEFF